MTEATCGVGNMVKMLTSGQCEIVSQGKKGGFVEEARASLWEGRVVLTIASGNAPEFVAFLMLAGIPADCPLILDQRYTEKTFMNAKEVRYLALTLARGGCIDDLFRQVVCRALQKIPEPIELPQQSIMNVLQTLNKNPSVGG